MGRSKGQWQVQGARTLLVVWGKSRKASFGNGDGPVSLHALKTLQSFEQFA